MASNTTPDRLDRVILRHLRQQEQKKGSTLIGSLVCSKGDGNNFTTTDVEERLGRLSDWVEKPDFSDAPWCTIESKRAALDTLLETKEAETQTETGSISSTQNHQPTRSLPMPKNPYTARECDMARKWLFREVPHVKTMSAKISIMSSFDTCVKETIPEPVMKLICNGRAVPDGPTPDEMSYYARQLCTKVLQCLKAPVPNPPGGGVHIPVGGPKGY